MDTSYIVTATEPLPDGKERVHFLVSGNRRFSVTIQAWVNNRVTREKIAAALGRVDVATEHPPSGATERAKQYL